MSSIVVAGFSITKKNCDFMNTTKKNLKLKIILGDQWKCCDWIEIKARNTHFDLSV